MQDVQVQLRRDERSKILGISYILGSVLFGGRQIGCSYAWTQIQNHLSVPARETQQRSPDAEMITTASDRIAQERKRQLREQYLVLREQVRQKEAFRDSNHDDIDIAIAILALKEGEAIDEVEALLTQSDRERLLQQPLPKQEYLVSACEYVAYISQTAIALAKRERSYCRRTTGSSGAKTKTTGDVDLRL